MLQGKKGVILGVANKNSIAWGIAQALHGAGAKIAFNYAIDKLESRVRELAETQEGSLVLPCDVSSDEQIAAFFAGCAERGFDKIDFLVHSLAWANREDLSNPFVQTSREGFRLAHDISAYSLTAVTRAASEMFNPGASIVTLTYLGAERAIINYNVMGVAKAALESSVRYLAMDLGPRQIRVNGISAGPIRTLAASGIAGFKEMLRVNEEKAPLRRTPEVSEVANAALFLISPLSSAITGEIIHVDCGYNIMGF